MKGAISARELPRDGLTGLTLHSEKRDHSKRTGSEEWFQEKKIQSNRISLDTLTRIGHI